MKNYLKTHRKYLFSEIFYSKYIKVLFLLLSISTLFFLAESAFARAGGGGGYSSSGGGSFGGGGSGGGGSIFLLIYFCLRYPYIGIPLAVIFIFLTYKGSKGVKSGYVSRTIRSGYANQMQNNLAEIINQIKSRDEMFSTDELVKRIKTGFIKIQEAWASQNLKNVRYIMTDGVFERFSIQLQIQKNSKIINKMENIQFLMAQVVAAETDHYFDTVHVMVTASASDYFVDMETNKIIYGKISPETFTEYWSFLRRPGAKTLNTHGVFEGFCPSCGTPLEISDSIVCPSCGAIVNSGEYDWILSEITQPSEWKIKPSENIIGLDSMLKKDPAFNIQHIEDKTSVIFYRNIASSFFADKRYIAKMSIEDFIQKHNTEYVPDKTGKHSFYADAAIGAVEVVEIINDANSNGQDKIRVKVKWAGHPLKAKIPSSIQPAYEHNRIYTQEYILLRNSNVITSQKNILTSSHCPNCGAPETITTSGSCEYCGARLNDGSRDWVLSEITYFAGYPHHNTHYESLQHDYTKVNGNPFGRFDNENILACSAAVMMIDGNISEKEQRLLGGMAKNRGISLEKLNIIVASVKEHGLHIPSPETLDESQQFLRCMVRMCLADGKVTPKERQLIKQLVSKMNYSDIDIDLMIKQERINLYKSAKQISKAD